MSDFTSLHQGETRIHHVKAPANPTLKTYNFYLVEHSEGLYLIDAGMNNEHCEKAFMHMLQKLNFTMEDLNGIILTHHHPDHVGLVHRIQRRNPNIKVYAHPASIPYITQDKEFLVERIAFFEEMYHVMDAMPDAHRQIEEMKKSLVANEPLRIEGDIELIQEGDQILDFNVVEVPGHAPDQIMLYDPNKKWAFVGDLVIEHMSTNAIIEPDREGRLLPTVTQHLESLYRCLSLKAMRLFSGHGDVIQETESVIQNKIARLQQKQERIMNLIRAGYRTAGEMARFYYQDNYKQQFFLVMSEVIGLLDHLERTGRIVSRKMRGKYHYFIRLS